MKEPIEVSETTYKAIDDALENLWYELPWRRIFTDGKRGTYDDVIQRYDLVCTENGQFVRVQLVSKENPSNMIFDQNFHRYM
ncbi:MAG: hypothetical protein CMF22_10390 [Idiomarinaceae bacterium]|nr:hypothetical protein [Idiomarinaceae bacterium]MBG23849.1 hypothetical protein [Idiomarinaceae bacterium]|tara:strand:+ start:264 stop:509 length:246 start_codon:yes stop_codon:yes gene_type:complete